MDELRRANKDLWEKWTDLHVGSDFYDVESFKAGRDSLDAVELEGVGDVDGKTLLHLQCHFGQDTLSWARRGARVMGVDFSERAIAFARGLAEELGLDARFVCSDVCQVREHLGGERFDVVFTSYGTVSWLPDIETWARVVADSLEPGGTFFMADHHPILWVFDEKAEERALRFKYGYFDREPVRGEEKGSYAVPDADVEVVGYFWQHTFEGIVGSLLSAGLRLTCLREYPYLAFKWFDYMERGEDGFWRMPEGMPDIPLMFSLTATKDG
jgi:2-polyprenyl-3-methyl-5-hydroxy-6-metoxy-1,4-benzoquinol methylase